MRGEFVRFAVVIFVLGNMVPETIKSSLKIAFIFLGVKMPQGDLHMYDPKKGFPPSSILYL